MVKRSLISLVGGALACGLGGGHATIANAQDFMWSTGEVGANLVKIDLATGRTTNIGATRQTEVWACTLTPDGQLWTITDSFTSRLSKVGRFNQQTGRVEAFFPATTGDVIALESEDNSLLYGVGLDGKFYRYDLSRGTATLVGDTGVVGIMDLAFDPQGRLWGTDTLRLYQIDPATAVTRPGAVFQNVMGIMGMAFHSDGRLFLTLYSENGILFTMNPDTGIGRTVGAIDQPFVHGGDIRMQSLMAGTRQVFSHRGAIQNGGPTELAASDDRYVDVRAKVEEGSSEPYIDLQLEGESPMEEPDTVSLQMETHFTLRGMRETVEFFDAVADEWVETGRHPSQTTDTVWYAIGPSGRRFVEATSNRVRARVRVVPAGPVFRMLECEYSIDRATWRFAGR